MSRRRPFFRALVIAFAAMQLASVAVAPIVEAVVIAGDILPPSDRDSVTPAPRHSHDASTCPACRVLNSDYQPEAEAQWSRVSRPVERATHDVYSAPALVTALSVLPRAPPSPDC